MGLEAFLDLTKFRQRSSTSGPGLSLEDFIALSILLVLLATSATDEDPAHPYTHSRLRSIFPKSEEWILRMIPTSNTDLKKDFFLTRRNKVAVVTGGNRGLGYGIVRKLCQSFPGDVYITCRNSEDGAKALEQLKKEGLNPKVHILDITLAESIQEFRRHLENAGGLDVLINNAATAYLHTGVVAEDVKTAEATLGCNYFGTLSLCEELFPLLRPFARVVNIVSSCGVFAITGNEPKSEGIRKKLSNPNLSIPDLNDIMKGYLSSVANGSVKEDGWQDIVVSSNNISKIGLQTLTSLQQREMDGRRGEDGIVINSLHPGLIRTEKAAEFPGHMLSIDEAAKGPCEAATLPPGPDVPKGQFLWTDLRVVDWINGPIPWCL